ncbi:hypothetical protein MNBD_GAMMA09-3422 [hydrothermal vent metagenome]|uniref:Thioredoxin-like fold domain-containing protein n=1 Tax=hydrothermal vent metagenome TaxID=652676 RepID=A0A3B0XYE9_9ZZZZ
MKLQLVLAGPYQACIKTKQIWSDICQQHGLNLDITDIDSNTGKALEQSLNIKSFPALIVDQQVKAVGHPSEVAAEKLINNLTQKQD